MNLPDDYKPNPIRLEMLEANDQWILNRFDTALEKYNKAFSNYHFYEMAQVIYEFIWGDFCDWYIELVKPRIYGKSSAISTSIRSTNALG